MALLVKTYLVVMRKYTGRVFVVVMLNYREAHYELSYKIMRNLCLTNDAQYPVLCLYNETINDMTDLSFKRARNIRQDRVACFLAVSIVYFQQTYGNVKQSARFIKLALALDGQPSKPRSSCFLTNCMRHTCMIWTLLLQLCRLAWNGGRGKEKKECRTSLKKQTTFIK